MFGNKRKTIGVFATQEFQEFQETLSRGICKRAEELGYNVALFTNFIGYGEIQYEIGERSIADLPIYEKFDGIILMTDTMRIQGFEACIRKNIEKYAKCPIVSVRQRTDDFYNVIIDDNIVLEDIIRHFIIEHRFRKINYYSGSKDSHISLQRLECYRKILEEYGIPYEEERVFYGDYWNNEAKNALDKWLSDPDLYPEAIICVNDYTAISICNELEERGLSVPEDVAVSGCDNIMITQEFSPNITTIEIPVFEMGMEAVDKIHRHNQGISQEQDTIMSTTTKIRKSCGCRHKDIKAGVKVKRNRIVNELESRQHEISNVSFMSVELTSIKSMEDFNRMLSEYAYMNEGLSSFFLCLHKNWDIYKEDNTKGKFQDDMQMELGINKNKILKQVEFSRSELLPHQYMKPEPQVFFFNVLHYQGNCFGYTAISFEGNRVYKPFYQGWLINVCNALENIRIHSELNRLVYRLEDIYIKDDLTDLYNRRALETLGQKYLERCVQQQCRLMVFTADMDKLKYINDNFGHASGDIAIRAIADAIKTAAEDDEICIRMGGDEFLVVGQDYDQQKMNHFLEKFVSEIERFNREVAKDYKIDVSYGWSIVKPNKFISIEDCLIVADSKMYQQKYDKETRRLKHRGEMFEEDKNKERHD